MTEPAAPAPPATPPPAPSPAPAPAPTAAPPREAGKTGLTTDEQQQLADLLARQQAEAVEAGALVFVVEEPHSAFTFGGLTVTTEPTTVPAATVGPLTQAAAEAGVTLTQQESES